MSAVPAAVIRKVDARDQQSCVRCGVWIEDNGSRHHRQRRAVGGCTVQNLILLCGSGTTGCHAWAHAHPISARAAGYIVLTSVTRVADVPVLVWSLDPDTFGSLVWVLLDSGGNRDRINTPNAQELLAAFGQLPTIESETD